MTNMTSSTRACVQCLRNYEYFMLKQCLENISEGLLPGKMVASQTNTSSAICANSQPISDASDSKKVKSTFLYLLEDDLFWEGDLESLKMFIEADLQINGRWSSPRGETTQFSNPDFCLKWLGPIDKKLTIV